MTTTGRRRDVAWGYFVDPFVEGGVGIISTHETKALAMGWHKMAMECGRNPGPIFKIVGPRTQIRAGRGGKRGRRA